MAWGRRRHVTSTTHAGSTGATAAPVAGYSPGIPLCWQCGTRQNPCHCKVVGPTLGFVAFCVAAAVEWPIGSVVYCFRRIKGRRILTHPNRVVYPRVRSAIPF